MKETNSSFLRITSKAPIRIQLNLYTAFEWIWQSNLLYKISFFPDKCFERKWKLNFQVSKYPLRWNAENMTSSNISIYYFDVDCYLHVLSPTLMIYIFTTIELQKYAYCSNCYSLSIEFYLRDVSFYQLQHRLHLDIWEEKHFFSFILDKVLAINNKRNQLKIKGIKVYCS